MNIAVLGTGFGAYHVELYKNMDAVDDIYVFGRNPEKLDVLREKFGVKTTTNLDDIFGNDDIDLVDVCLPSTMHKEIVIKALEHCKHVFCETPFSLTMGDSVKMYEASKIYQKKVFVDLFLRFEYPYVFLHELNEKQKYGRLKTLRIQRKTPPFWGDLGLNKIMLDLMIHDIDFVTWILGSPREVRGCNAEGKPGQCAVTGLLQYVDGFVEVVGSSMMPVSYPFAVAYEAIFEDAVVKYYEDGYQDHVIHSLEVFTSSGIEKVKIPQGNCYENAIRHVLQCVLGEATPINGIEAAMLSLEAALILKEQVQNHHS